MFCVYLFGSLVLMLTCVDVGLQLMQKREADNDNANANATTDEGRDQPPSSPKEKAPTIETQKEAIPAGQTEEASKEHTQHESPPRPRKRRKTSETSEESEEDAEVASSSDKTDGGVKEPVKKQPRQAKKAPTKREKTQSETEESDAAEEQAAGPSTNADSSESEMSDVIDEAPKDKLTRKKSAEAPSRKQTKETAGKGKTQKKGKDSDKVPNQADGSESEMSEVLDEDPKDKRRRGNSTEAPRKQTKKPAENGKAQSKGKNADKNSDQADGSESEMSEVLDEAPKDKPRRENSTEAPKQTKKTTGKGKTQKKGKDADLDPDQAEIKRLQGWLVKCGIRKMWSRELAPYDTAKAKIRHLKDMLSDAGMKGRCSLEKARQIREERELKADLEQVQEGAKKWGTASGDEENDGGKSRRRRTAPGRMSLTFLENDNNEEGEESE